MKKLVLFFTVFSILLVGCSGKQTSTGSPASDETPSSDTATVTEAPQNTDAPEDSSESKDESASALLSAKYVDIIKSSNYYMEANVQGESGISAFSVSVHGSDIAMETTSDGIVYNTVIRDGITYMIDHQNKLVITSGTEVASSASNMAGDAISTEGISFSSKGSGSFFGETLPYEEYKTAGGTMRFYLRNDALAGIESIDSVTTAYQIITLTSGYKAAMHEVPSAYQLLDMAALGG